MDELFAYLVGIAITRHTPPYTLWLDILYFWVTRNGNGVTPFLQGGTAQYYL